MVCVRSRIPQKLYRGQCVYYSVADLEAGKGCGRFLFHWALDRCRWRESLKVQTARFGEGDIQEHFSYSEIPCLVILTVQNITTYF